MKGAIWLAVLLSLCCISSAKMPPVQDKQNCAACEAIVGAAMEIAGNQTQIQQLITILVNDCDKLNISDPLKKTCEQIATGAVNLLPWLKKELTSLAWDIPIAFCSVFLHECNILCCDQATPFKPEQLHISYTNNPSEMAVSWVTLQPGPQSLVQYGTDSPSMSAVGNFTTYTAGGWIGTIHYAIMTGLQPRTKYQYRVGSSQGWSQIFTFSTLPKISAHDKNAPPLRLVVVGDMSYDNFSDATVAHMIDLVNAGQVDAVLHPGDISYADGYQLHWDMFMRKIEPIAARIPYMVSPGNHEFWFNFTAYKARWFMPGFDVKSPDKSMFYSFNLGPIHFLSIDTETWIDTADINPTQKKWIEADLQLAHKQRDMQPWIVAYGHRPMYCSNSNKANCHTFADLLRQRLESSFLSYGVDLVIMAHQHDYERGWPTFNGKPTQQNYTNPLAPVYIVNGAAGNREGLTGGFVNPAPDWVAYRDREYGYGLLTYANCSLHWQFYANDGPTPGTLRDDITLIKANG